MKSHDTKDNQRTGGSFIFSLVSSECHHPRSPLPVRCVLGVAVSAGGSVYPGAHGARHEARRLQEAQQRGTESLAQPTGQRGRGEGAAPGGQQRITSANGGQTPLLRPDTPPPSCTYGQMHASWIRPDVRHSSDSSAMKRCLCPQHKSGRCFISSHLFLQGRRSDSQKSGLLRESVLHIFWGPVVEERCELVELDSFWFLEVVTEWSILRLSLLLVQNNTSDLV